VAEVPLLKELLKKYRDQGLEILGVSLDDEPAKVQRFIAEKGVSWPQICDGRVDEGPIPKLYSVTGTPDLYVIDRSGKIAARLRSAKQLDAKIAELK
jgi:peroxiredoxin